MQLLLGFVIGEVFAALALIGWGWLMDRQVGCPCREELADLESPHPRLPCLRQYPALHRAGEEAACRCERSSEEGPTA